MAEHRARKVSTSSPGREIVAGAVGGRFILIPLDQVRKAYAPLRSSMYSGHASRPDLEIDRLDLFPSGFPRILSYIPALAARAD